MFSCDLGEDEKRKSPLTRDSWNYMKLCLQLLYLIDINKSVHVNMLSEIFYTDIKHFQFLLIKISKVCFKEKSYFEKRHFRQPSFTDANKQNPTISN